MRFAFHPLFFQDVEDQRHYYNEKEVGLGNDFARDVDATLDKIQGDPLLFSPVYRNVRRWRLSRFKKFSVRYEVIQSENVIRILGVFHGARRSSYGRDRK